MTSITELMWRREHEKSADVNRRITKSKEASASKNNNARPSAARKAGSVASTQEDGIGAVNTDVQARQDPSVWVLK